MSLLESGLKAAFQCEENHLRELLVSWPAFRSHISLKAYPMLELITPERNLWQTDQLLWNIYELSKHNGFESAPRSFHFAFIDKILASCSRKGKGRVDQMLYDQISDMAAIDEALSAIKYHRSHTISPTSEDELEDFYMRWKAESVDIVPALVTWHRKGDAGLWAKLESFRNMPLPSARVTKEHISRMKDLHQALGNYWQEVRNVKESYLRWVRAPEDVISEYVELFCIFLLRPIVHLTYAQDGG